MRRARRTKRTKRTDKDPYKKTIALSDPREDGRLGRQHAGSLQVTVYSWNRSKLHVGSWIGRTDFGVDLTKREATDFVRAMREGIRKLKQDR